MGWRYVPRARPKRLLAPSATTVKAAAHLGRGAVAADQSGAAHETAFDDRCRRLVVAEHGGAGRDGVFDEDRVEPFPRCHETMVGLLLVRRASARPSSPTVS